ncbi:hypothetical protein [Hoeflea sp. TYP-13]|uniref:hypothetical protein n=1 Tax=Hoeflea sp. TYP-13 TaxID=3230023 RepID=UPI0034C64184
MADLGQVLPFVYRISALPVRTRASQLSAEHLTRLPGLEFMAAFGADNSAYGFRVTSGEKSLRAD